MKRCSQCGKENMDHESFCSACGNSLQIANTGKSCPSCQAPVALDDRFCDNCGATLPETPSGGFSPTPQNPPHGSTRPMSNSGSMGVGNQPPYQPPLQQPGGFPQQGYAPFPNAPFQQKKKSPIPLIAAALVLLLLIGGGVYYFLLRDKPTDVTLDNNKNTVDQNTPNNTDTNTNNTDTNTDQKNTNNTDTNTNNTDTSNNNTDTNIPKNDLGFKEKYFGTFNYPVRFYQVADFQGDGITELVVGTSGDDKSHISALSWDGANFTETSFLDIPGPILELNASKPQDGKQFIYIPSSNKKIYSLEEQDGKFYYDSLDWPDQPLSIAEGYFDSDDAIDYAVYTQKDDGTFAITFKPSLVKDTKDMTVDKQFGNMFMADFDGDAVSDMLYLDADDQGAWVNVSFWDGTSFQPAGRTTFGDQLINYYPYDVDGDAISEVITTNLVDNDIEGRVWKWDTTNNKFIAIDRFIVDNPDAQQAHPVAGDFDGDGKIDIMMLMNHFDGKTWSFKIYSR